MFLRIRNIVDIYHQLINNINKYLQIECTCSEVMGRGALKRALSSSDDDRSAHGTGAPFCS